MTSAIDAAIAKVDELIARSGAGGSAGAPAAPAAAAAAPSAAGGSAPAPAAPAATAAAATSSEPGKAEPGGRETITGKANLKVARVLSAEPLAGSDKLLKLQVDVGESGAGEPDRRQIMAGLQQYLSPTDLIDKLLVIVANLKPAKLAGELSQGMVLAGEGAGGGGERIVRTLVPPAGAAPGDDVVVEGHAPAPLPPVGASKKQTEAAMMKKEAWWGAAAGLVVRGGRATFEGTALVLANGAAAGQAVMLPAEIPEGASIC